MRSVIPAHLLAFAFPQQIELLKVCLISVILFCPERQGAIDGDDKCRVTWQR